MKFGFVQYFEIAKKVINPLWLLELQYNMSLAFSTLRNTFATLRNE